MASVRFFVVACVLGGVGGALGSMIGAALGQRALFIGGFVGGLAVAPLIALLAVRRRWIDGHQFWPVVAGCGLGFIAAATIAVNTLSSPIGPVLSTSLTGVGALLGRRLSR